MSGEGASAFTFTLTTPPRPGAIAVLQLHGDGAANALESLTGIGPRPLGRLRLCDLAGVDEGLAVVARSAPSAAHAPRRAAGDRQAHRHAPRTRRTVRGGRPAPSELYPEAASPIEADTLAAVARAASPAAIDLLAAQPAVWLDVLAGEASPCAAMNDEQRRAILDRSRPSIA